MCCLFGLLDYQRHLPLETRKTIIRELSVASESRGTDATGIAYFKQNRLYVQKAPRAAHRMRFHVNGDAHFIMGHTRMTTQGNEKKNYNNHPFSGRAGKTTFALAHNGVIHNDRELRTARHLPPSIIETDSYIAVQLLEKDGVINFGSLRYMAEALRGSFTITVLDGKNNLYVVCGNNPICIYHFESLGFYIYASTKDILDKAVKRLSLDIISHKEIPIDSGDILRIAVNGTRKKESFNDSAIWSFPIYSLWGVPVQNEHKKEKYDDTLMLYSQISGYDCDTFACLRSAGYSWLEIEQMIYDPELMDECISGVMCG